MALCLRPDPVPALIAIDTEVLCLHCLAAVATALVYTNRSGAGSTVAIVVLLACTFTLWCPRSG